MNNYIIKLKDKIVSMYYHKGDESDVGSVMCRIFKDNVWQEPTTVVPECNGKFSLSLEDNISIFCEGMLYQTDKNIIDWVSEKTDLPTNATVHTLGDTTVYSDAHAIFLKETNKDAFSIDEYLQQANLDFTAQKITNDHMVIFYQSIQSEAVQNRRPNLFSKEEIEEHYNNIGYMEVSDGGHGVFRPIHTTYYNIADTSFITTGSKIHALYIVKSMFSYQLVYKCKAGEAFDKPIVVWEGQKMDKCLLSIINGEINVFFRYRGHTFTSKKKGNSFTKPEVYKNKICKITKKATFISEKTMDENDFFVCDVYVDKYNPWDVQILPDMHKSFYLLEQVDQAKQVAQIEAIPQQPIPITADLSYTYAENPPTWDMAKMFQNQIIQDTETIMAQEWKTDIKQKPSVDIDIIVQEQKYLNKIEKLNERVRELEEELKKVQN